MPVFDAQNVVLEVPEGLDELGRQAFDRIVSLLKRNGTLRKEFATVIELFASAYSEWHALNIIVAEEGFTYVTTTAPGAVKIYARPEVAQRSDAWKRCESALVKLGLVPASKTDKPVEKSNPFGEFGLS